MAASFALWWSKQKNPAAASVLGPVVAISLMAYTTFITSRQQRRCRAVGLAYVYGVSLVVAMQALVGLVAAGIWWRRMGGMRER